MYNIMTHVLKTDPFVFHESWEGRKTYEIRLNDRDYKKGDILILRESTLGDDGLHSGYTGRELHGVVSHVLYGPIYGLEKGWCIMSLPVLRKAMADDGGEG